VIIHSIVTDETLYAGLDDIRAPEELTINGVLMQVERLTNNQAKVVRIISPELHHYMNEKFSPGQIISFQPCPLQN
jgi:hypothetical protein